MIQYLKSFFSPAQEDTAVPENGTHQCNKCHIVIPKYYKMCRECYNKSKIRCNGCGYLVPSHITPDTCWSCIKMNIEKSRVKCPGICGQRVVPSEHCKTCAGLTSCSRCKRTIDKISALDHPADASREQICVACNNDVYLLSRCTSADHRKIINSNGTVGSCVYCDTYRTTHTDKNRDYIECPDNCDWEDTAIVAMSAFLLDHPEVTFVKAVLKEDGWSYEWDDTVTATFSVKFQGCNEQEHLIVTWNESGCSCNSLESFCSLPSFEPSCIYQEGKWYKL